MSERIRVLLKTLGLTQKDFADEIGITQGFVSDVIRRGKSLSQETLVKISFRYRVSLNWLLTGEGEMFIPEAQEIFKQTDESRELLGKLKRREGMVDFLHLLTNLSDDEWKRLREMVRVLFHK